ncbi:hypothetical protein KHA80_22655 [Anaerobacillus sp. HL2]|nr:hypothetical protein KHA80_22655 [Anaerobacillus sp. HL2]
MAYDNFIKFNELSLFENNKSNMWLGGGSQQEAYLNPNELRVIIISHILLQKSQDLNKVTENALKADIVVLPKISGESNEIKRISLDIR